MVFKVLHGKDLTIDDRDKLVDQHRANWCAAGKHRPDDQDSPSDGMYRASPRHEFTMRVVHGSSMPPDDRQGWVRSLLSPTGLSTHTIRKPSDQGNSKGLAYGEVEASAGFVRLRV